MSTRWISGLHNTQYRGLLDSVLRLSSPGVHSGSTSKYFFLVVVVL